MNYYIKKDDILISLLTVPIGLQSNEIIPQGIHKIDNLACANNTTISKLIIPNCVKVISQGAFYNCKNLTEVIIPETCELVEDGAFANCPLLTKITYSKNTRFGSKCFSGCKKLKYITQGENTARIFYFPVHNNFAITIEQKDLEQSNIKVYAGRFADEFFPCSTPQLDRPLLYFVEINDQFIWYDKYFDDALLGAKYQASKKSATEFFHKTYDLNTEISARECSLLTGICYQGREAWKIITHKDEDEKFRIGDLLATIKNFAPKVYSRILYVLENQNRPINLLNLDNGISWDDVDLLKKQ